ncbi:hypothetical protein TREMEDRAFT_61306 [Tremella mesenterica DSM 1558]|uniref:uncharacterized protein n=1 Tax=Tremella mesenterica (strain ATCC 24925 / CBS 8224 / DSM 1558 / NBRC 9311 / NRRL Y-6157 / RJB 2259-6 / UBC 559-6) TaxID=578456 RepID=UPI0003F492E0|nr:uncharacterized protein TREMEDRAFT_61306 [Tremella mesenterica DSM 1558]EIW70799.1 hypothetical protein TREMEDRAFT_61306 [Tremella mesenterica DSM 1558]
MSETATNVNQKSLGGIRTRLSQIVRGLIDRVRRSRRTQTSISDSRYSSSLIAESSSSQPHSWDTQSRIDDPQTVFDTHGFAALIRVDETSDGIFQPTITYSLCVSYSQALVSRPDGRRTSAGDDTLDIFDRLQQPNFADEETQHEWVRTVLECHRNLHDDLSDKLKSLSRLGSTDKLIQINKICGSLGDTLSAVKEYPSLGMVVWCDNREIYEFLVKTSSFNFDPKEYECRRVDEGTRFEDRLDGTVYEDPPRGRTLLRSK